MIRGGKSKSQVEKNKKVCDDLDENILFDEEDNPEIDEVINGGFTSGDIDVLKTDSTIEINHFFNELPIRILNSHQFPFFYAEDVCKILNIKNTRKSVENFTEHEIVSQELRQKYNITTYKIHRGKRAIDNRKILLTEFGVYRLLMNSRSQLAEQFRTFVYQVLYQLRTVGEYKIKADLEQLQITNELLRKDNERLQTKVSEFKNLCDEIVLIEYPNDPWEIAPTNIPAKHISKHQKVRLNPKKNSIDNPVPHAHRLAQELGKRLPIVDVPVDSSSAELARAHEQNIVIAREFITANTPPNSYLVTANATAEQLTDGNVLHRVYVKDRAASLRTLTDRLRDFKPTRSSSRSHWYSCDKQKIIDSMNAVAD
jgi:prophage antirepressor-like protein